MGARLAYYLLILPISFLPYFILYRISDFFYLVFITVFPYRKKVIEGNLKRVFPEKSPKEIKRIRNGFYRHLSDIIAESFKNFTISKKQADKRMKPFGNEEMAKVVGEGQGIVLAGGHYNNWELYAVAGADHVPGKVMAIYKRLSNAFLDEKMRRSRGKFGLEMIPTVETSEWMKTETAKGPVTSVYAVDQSPANPQKAHWMEFLGQKTAVYFGAEKHAKKYNMAVFFGKLTKLKRGHYSITYELVTRDPNSYGHGELVEELNRRVEEQILEAPQYWLWSHKRWKHPFKEEYLTQESLTK